MCQPQEVVGTEVCCWLVDDLQAELKDARLEGAADSSAVSADGGSGGCAHRSAKLTGRGGRIVEVGVVKDVVSFRAELDLQVCERGVKPLVEVQIRLVVKRQTDRVAGRSAEGSGDDGIVVGGDSGRGSGLGSACIGRRQLEGSQIDVINGAVGWIPLAQAGMS